MAFWRVSLVADDSMPHTGGARRDSEWGGACARVRLIINSYTYPDKP